VLGCAQKFVSCRSTYSLLARLAPSTAYPGLSSNISTLFLRVHPDLENSRQHRGIGWGYSNLILVTMPSEGLRKGHGIDVGGQKWLCGGSADDHVLRRP